MIVMVMMIDGDGDGDGDGDKMAKNHFSGVQNGSQSV